jgi:hypothetical protein
MIVVLLLFKMDYIVFAQTLLTKTAGDKNHLLFF